MSKTFLGLPLELDLAAPADMIRMVDEKGQIVAESLTGHVAYQVEATGENRIVKLIVGPAVFDRLSGEKSNSG